MNAVLKKMFKGQMHNYPQHLEAKFSRILNKIMELWGTKELDAYFNELMIDYKGDRQGFPPEVSSEIFMLSQMHDKVMEGKLKEEVDIWGNEVIKRGLEAENIEYSIRGFFKALDLGNLRAIQLFIDAGVNLEQLNDAGWTPLMISSFMGSEEAAAMLINAGANVNAKDNRGYGPLHWAAYQGYTAIVKMLIDKGASVNAKSRMGLTPLLQAAACGHPSTVEMLISREATVNEADDEGWTPLHKAVANGHLEVIAMLMLSNADPEIPHGSGLTASAMAKNKNNLAIVQLLNVR